MIDLQQTNGKNVLSAEEARSLGQQIENHEISKNIAIYTMPERFRSADTQTKARTSGFLVLLVGLVLLFLIMGSFYYYFFILKGNHSFSGFNFLAKQSVKEQPSKPTNQGNSGHKLTKNKNSNSDKSQDQPTKPTDKQPPDQVINQAKQAYFQFEQSLLAVNTLSAYGQLAEKYALADFLSQCQRQQEKISQLPAADQTEFFKLLASQQPDYNQLEQNLKAEKLSSTEVKLSETKNLVVINMKKTNNHWLIAERKGFFVLLPNGATTTLDDWLEQKLANQPSTQSNEPELQSAPDTDQDGLADLAEKLLGTNINNSDTDQDGYSDYQELINLYNPAGKGKLADNPLIATYFNPTFSFSFLYPAQWDVQKVDDDQSIIFKTNNDQFFQIVVQPNADNQTISSWYQQQFGVSAISSKQFISQAEPNNQGQKLWQGIKTKDGLTVYITPPAQDIILTITYSPGTSNTLYFSAIMDMILASLHFSN